MNLTEKLESLKAEKAQKEAEKDAAHQRIIVLNRLIKQDEGLIKDANEIFQEKAFEGDNGSMVGKSY